MPSLKIKRGTRAQIEAAKAASGLNSGEPLLITDEDRLAVGTGTAAYTDFAKKSELVAFASSAENAAGTVENKAVDPLGIREAFNATGPAPVFACRAWVVFNGSASGTWTGGASTVTRAGGSTTATVTTTNDHGLITGSRVQALSGVVAGPYAVTVTGAKTFTITTAATTALTSVAITFAVNSILASGNVSSVADYGTGNPHVNFMTALPDENYAVSVGMLTTSPLARMWIGDVRFAEGYRFLTGYPSSTTGAFTAADVGDVSVSFFR